jgi:hypothetical protein
MTVRDAMTVSGAAADSGPPPGARVVTAAKPPLYWRMLRLRNLRPNGWQRAVLVEGVLGVSVVLVLADVASAWTLLVMPLASAAVVKGHDVLLGMLQGLSGSQR